MTLVSLDGAPVMFFPTLAAALSYIRRLSGAVRSRLTLTSYAGRPLSR